MDEEVAVFAGLDGVWPRRRWRIGVQDPAYSSAYCNRPERTDHIWRRDSDGRRNAPDDGVDAERWLERCTRFPGRFHRGLTIHSVHERSTHRRRPTNSPPNTVLTCHRGSRTAGILIPSVQRNYMAEYNAPPGMVVLLHFGDRPFLRRG